MNIDHIKQSIEHHKTFHLNGFIGELLVMLRVNPLLGIGVSLISCFTNLHSKSIISQAAITVFIRILIYDLFEFAH